MLCCSNPKFGDFPVLNSSWGRSNCRIELRADEKATRIRHATCVTVIPSDTSTHKPQKSPGKLGFVKLHVRHTSITWDRWDGKRPNWLFRKYHTRHRKLFESDVTIPSPLRRAFVASSRPALIINKTKMDSLKFVAAKVKHSPQIIRKTFSSSHSPYAKVLEGEKSKGKSGEHYSNIAEQVSRWSVN